MKALLALTNPVRVKLLFPILLLFFPLSGYADYSVQGVHTSCSENGFEVSSINLMNETPSDEVVKEGKGNAAFFGTNKHVVRCLVGSRKVKTEFSTGEPRERGACGGAPGASLALWIDGVQVLGYKLFNNECFESLEKISFRHSKQDGYVMTVCGHTAHGFKEYRNGCFKLKESEFRSLIEPRNPFPLSTLIDNKALQMTPIGDAE